MIRIFNISVIWMGYTDFPGESRTVFKKLFLNSTSRKNPVLNSKASVEQF